MLFIVFLELLKPDTPVLLLFPITVFAQDIESSLFPFFRGQPSGYFDPADISVNDSIEIYSRNGEFQNVKVLSYTVTPKKTGDDVWLHNEGARLTPVSVQVLKGQPVNTLVFFEDIKVVVGPDTVTLYSKTFRTDGLKACVYSLPGETEGTFRSCLDTNDIRTCGSEKLKFYGSISRKALAGNDYIYVDAKETKKDPDQKFQITEYEMTFLDKSWQQIMVVKENSDRISQKTKRITLHNKKVFHIEITHVRATDCDGNQVAIGSLLLHLL